MSIYKFNKYRQRNPCIYVRKEKSLNASMCVQTQVAHMYNSRNVSNIKIVVYEEHMFLTWNILRL